MKNTQENKERFFAQYWGQRLVRDKILIGEGVDNVADTLIQNWSSQVFDYLLLELKSLKDISDEDCSYLMSFIDDSAIHLFDITIESTRKEIIRGSYVINVRETDYLRSKGYLVPWMGLSCEDILKRGWAKYKNN